MIKDLLITDIPKDALSLKKVLSVLRDFSWSAEAINDWETSNSKYLYHDSRYDQYLTSKNPPREVRLRVVTFEQVIGGLE